MLADEVKIYKESEDLEYGKGKRVKKMLSMN
jgi:hypothetical protein